MNEEKNINKIREFFKSNVIIKDIGEVLTFKPDTLIGIDRVSGKSLEKNNINTIKDLADLSEDDPPKIGGILPKIIKKWIKIAQVLKKTVHEQLKEQKKVILIGLDNGGKTSLLSVLQERFSVIKDLLPTRGVQREHLNLFGFNLISWDLGGQVQYRENLYFNKPELFFAEVDLLIYVIDIQDNKRFTESANYFRQVLEVLEDLEEFPPILVVLNKSDPDFRKSLQFKKNRNAIEKKFELILEDKKEFDIDYTDTTIFQRETVLRMFSKALSYISETSEIIEGILREFSEKINAGGVSLVSLDGLIFGNYCEEKKDEHLLNNTALLLQTLSNFHKSTGLKIESTINLKLSKNNLEFLGKKLFNYSESNIPIYLWILLSKEPTDLKPALKYFEKQLSPLINFFL
ncbi:MAG: ADP-ribosylation factor-like protein [Promethearchaeia archaeon]